MLVPFHYIRHPMSCCRHIRTYSGGVRSGGCDSRRNWSNAVTTTATTTTTTALTSYKKKIVVPQYQPYQYQQTRSVQYLLDPKSIPMMKYHPNHETKTIRAYNQIHRQERVVIQWFTLSNLRLLDNATLFHAAEMAFDSRLAERRKRSPPKEDSCYIIPLFIFDTTTIFGCDQLTPSGDLRMNIRRAKFILDAVLDVRKQLEDVYHSKLAIACQDPKLCWTQLLAQIPTTIPMDVFVANDPIRESRSLVRTIHNAVTVNRKRSQVHTIWDSSIYDPKYIHYGGKNVPLLPNDMEEFRKQIDKRGKYKQHPLYPIPKYLLYPPPPPEVVVASTSSSLSGKVFSPEEVVVSETESVSSEFQNTVSSDETSWYETPPPPAAAAATTPPPTTTSSIADYDTYNKNNPTDGLLYNLFHEMTQYTPTLQDLGYTDAQIAALEQENDDPRCIVPKTLRGGETAAKGRLNEYFWHQDLLKAAYTTRDGVMNPLVDSSKFSVYLSHGCISPKFIVEEIKRYRKARISNQSTFWFEFQLYKREFCKLYFVKHGEKVFLPNGPNGGEDRDKVWTTHREQLQAWKDGQTGYPFVDACMRELKLTGCMSKLGRQVTAYFLTYHLSHDWRNGGDWFESQLLDCDIYSNWVNWCHLAGGTGAEVKHICPIQRAINTEHYIKLWVPELRNLPTAFIYKPYIMNETQQKEYNIQLGVDYPLPIIKLSDPPPLPEEITKKRKKVRVNRIIRKKKMKR